MNRIAALICLFGALVGNPFGPLTHAQDLPSWKNTKTREAILSFVDRVTREGSSDYVAPADRIAVFDNDGTLWVEKPVYNQLAFAVDRVKAMADEHPEWNDEEPFKSLLAGDLAGVAATGHEGIAKIIGVTHAGVSVEQFEEIVMKWVETSRHPTLKRRYTECVYQPQLELLSYLRDKGFKTFIVSGGGVDFMRPWTNDVYGIPPEQVVGSMLKSEYQVNDGEAQVIKLGEIDFVDDKAGKPVGIHRFIGKRPILAFGNSDGDFEMIEYTTAQAGPSLGLILHHDDGEREWAYDRDSSVGRLVRGLDEADERNWIIVSMKDDWSTIFPKQD